MSHPGAAISTAFTQTRRVLFEPFDAAKYVGLAVCVWLYQLGHVGGAPAAFRGGPSPGASPAESMNDANVREVSALLLDWAPILAAALVAAAVVGFAVTALVLWLQSRATFMVIDNLVKHDGAIAEPWRLFATEGDSLFRLRLIVNIVGAGVAVVIGAIAAVATWVGWHGGALHPLQMATVSVGVIAVSSVAAVTMITDGCATEFVAPLMYVRRCTATQGFRDLGGFLRRDPGGFATYALLRAGVAIAVGVLSVVATVFTCGLAALPFLGTLALLPLLVYMRMFSLHFVAGLADDLGPLGPSKVDVPRDTIPHGGALTAK